MKKILLVEDDPFLQSLYTDLLTEAKYAVTAEGNGEKAYHLIAKAHWDLILLDNSLPGMSGIEIVQRLKEDKSPALKQKIAFLSNADDEPTVTALKKTGLPHILKSSLTPDQFVSTVEGFL